MKKILNLSTLAACLLITACATDYAAKPAQETAQQVKVKNSEFDSKVTYIGPEIISETQRGLFMDSQFTRLVIQKDKNSNNLNYIIQSTITYSSKWRFYETVSFKDGTKANLTIRERDVISCSSGCILKESIQFPITLDKLIDNSDFKFRLNSKSGAENIIVIPKNYIQGVLSSQKSD